MADYNIKEVDSIFYEGKRLLDSRQYPEAIEVYSELISFAENYKDKQDAILTLVTSLNNRGISLCKLGLLKNDKNLYLKGMEDFRYSISFTQNKEEQNWLTAYSNLKFSEKEIEDFDRPRKDTSNFFRTI